jgi:hypothetical protein
MEIEVNRGHPGQRVYWHKALRGTTQPLSFAMHGLMREVRKRCPSFLSPSLSATGEMVSNHRTNDSRVNPVATALIIFVDGCIALHPAGGAFLVLAKDIDHRSKAKAKAGDYEKRQEEHGRRLG